MSLDEALGRLRALPYEDLGFAKVDQHRGLRSGAVEAIFCQGKTPEQVVAIARRLAEHATNVIATRADPEIAAAVAAAGLSHAYHAAARLIIVRPTPTDGIGLIAVVSAGTAGTPFPGGGARVSPAPRNPRGRPLPCGVGRAPPPPPPLQPPPPGPPDAGPGGTRGGAARR